jgi:hypothetical protein
VTFNVAQQVPTTQRCTQQAIRIRRQESRHLPVTIKWWVRCFFLWQSFGSHHFVIRLCSADTLLVQCKSRTIVTTPKYYYII